MLNRFMLGFNKAQMAVQGVKILGALALLVFATVASTPAAFGQNNNNGTNGTNGNNGNNNNNNNGNANFNFGNQVGGVYVNAKGFLSTSKGKIPASVSNFLAKDSGEFNRAMGKGSSLRKLSLTSINKIIADSAKNNRPLPAEVRYLGGITRIEYVYFDKENNDIVIAGHAENLAARPGHFGLFGYKTGLPAIHLEDFVTALRTARSSGTNKGISVSINPTKKSHLAFKRVMSQVSQGRLRLDNRVKSILEKEMGEQDVVLTGLPKDSRAASVLALADYRMKLISMGHATPQLRNPKKLPSFTQLVARSRNVKSLSPRFWMAMNYDDLLTNEEGNIWRLQGQAVQTLTEDNFINAEGEAKGSGKKNPIAAKWAKKMTTQYNDLSKGEPIFGELRNFFDMAVVAALIEKEQLVDKAGIKLDSLYGKNNDFRTQTWNTPSKVATKGKLLKIHNKTVVTASGGVQLDPWAVIEKVKVDASVDVVAAAPRNIKKGFYWD